MRGRAAYGPRAPASEPSGRRRPAGRGAPPRAAPSATAARGRTGPQVSTRPPKTRASSAARGSPLGHTPTPVTR
eukprot:757443-Pleurochrysis_carterae.AAC.1